MPSTNFKNFIIKRLEERGSEIDTSPGSNFRDLFINPLNVIFDDYQNEHDRLVRNLSLKDPRQLSEDELDAIGERYLVSRKEGSFSQGEIQIYYSEPQPLSIPQNSVFKHEGTGLEYETINSYDATRSRINNNLDPATNLFRTDPIKVRSTSKNQRGDLGTNTPLKTKSFISPSPDKILVSGDITGGNPREDNSTYFDRLKNSVRNSTLASKETIKTNVKAQNSDVEEVFVVGAGDSLMVRDLVEKGSLDPSRVEDFRFVDRGQEDNGYYKGHKAYLDTFQFENEISDDNVDWPQDPSQ